MALAIPEGICTAAASARRGDAEFALLVVGAVSRATGGSSCGHRCTSLCAMGPLGGARRSAVYKVQVSAGRIASRPEAEKARLFVEQPVRTSLPRSCSSARASWRGGGLGRWAARDARSWAVGAVAGADEMG